MLRTRPRQTLSRTLAFAFASTLLLALTAYAFQRPFRIYPSLEPYDNVPIPEGGDRPSELVFGRLMYPSSPRARFGGYGIWTQGGTSWTVDYPRGDRHFTAALQRLTRVDIRPLEQPVNPDDGDDIYNWPWLYVDLPGSWDLTDAQATKIRDFLLRGGFLYADNFWGPDEWEIFEEGMHRIFPDREMVDLDGDHNIFHAVFDTGDRYQIPGQWATRRGAMNRNGGVVPYWGGVYDDKGRVVVAITFNNDVGDSWEFADDPSYPEHYSALGLRLGANYVVYALTH
ncbi:MAG: DUF4159 domain-containing protein [Bryobacteraceae bacterium]